MSGETNDGESSPPPAACAARKEPIFRGIRRHYCEYCGICRSKKALIASHILAHHQDEMRVNSKEEVEGQMGVEEASFAKSNTCEECGAGFRKPAHLKQHMLTHSQDHKGKVFKCPDESCGKEFAYQGNMTRHDKEFHKNTESARIIGEKLHICQEAGCGKVFKYASKLRKHEESHVKFDSCEAVCLEHGCLQHFSNEECLKEHIRSCHQHMTCEICGTKQLRKNFKRHLRMHTVGTCSERVKCDFDSCDSTFSKRSNLQQHVKAIHLELRPFKCRFSDCGMAFSFKHVRDNHEKTTRHIYSEGEFVESEEQFSQRDKGGRKRKCPTFASVLRKRVCIPNHEFDYNAWLDAVDSA